MTTDLQPYPKYKASRLPWLNGIPEHWEEKRAKYYFREVDERSTTGTEQLMSVSHITGVTPRKSNVTMFMSESSIGHKLCRPGDLVINTMWAWMAAMGVARQVGVVSPSYGVYRPIDATLHISKYVDYLLRTQPYTSEFICLSKGIRPSRLRLYPEKFLGIPIVCPTHEEQEDILRFIGYHDQIFSRLIRNRRRLIEVLDEQKQDIISRIVTHGLDPDVPMHTTDIEWLDEIPDHWRMLKIKRIARINPSRTESSHLRQSDEKVVFLPMENVSTQGEINSTELKPICEVWQGFSYFQRGDVVVAKITPCFENGKGACLSHLPTKFGFGTTEFIVLRPSLEISAEYLYQCTKLSQFRLLGVESMTGAAGQQRISPEFIANFYIPVPPRSEQDEIVSTVKTETARFSATIEQAQREVDLIHEYRTHLIADVVTGRIDVRGLAPIDSDFETEIEYDELAASGDIDLISEDKEPGLVEETDNADD